MFRRWRRPSRRALPDPPPPPSPPPPSLPPALPPLVFVPVLWSCSRRCNLRRVSLSRRLCRSALFFLASSQRARARRSVDAALLSSAAADRLDEEDEEEEDESLLPLLPLLWTTLCRTGRGSQP